jgi:hypothetical protein
MNENHVIDSWVAELALGARTSRARWPRPARPAEADFGSVAGGTELAPVAARPVSRRISALLERPRSGGGALRPCLPGA